MLASALLLLAGLALSECHVYTQTLDAWDESDDHGKIVNGVSPRPNAYPFLVRLYISYGQSTYGCGGALINNKWVLTAAHCVVDDDGRKVTMIRVYLGAHNLGVYEQNRVETTADYFTTAAYDSQTMNNDVALIRLSKPVTFNRYISPICIAQTGTNAVGQEAVVAGWGAIGTDMPGSNVLLKIDLPILDDQSCSRKYGGYNNDVMMCAGYTDGSKDSCQGDSGGPLFVRGNTGYTTVGVVSFGIGCAEKGYPGVYAQVEHFTDWIQQTAVDGGRICVV